MLSVVFSSCRGGGYMEDPDGTLASDLLVENKGFCHIVPCLVHESTPSKAAFELIYEIAVEESGQNFLLKPRRLEAFIGLLENTNKSDVQKAAVGLLANLPKSEVTLTSKLIELEGLKAIIEMLESDNKEAKENALSVLFWFTDPTNIEAQKMVVELRRIINSWASLKTGRLQPRHERLLSSAIYPCVAPSSQ
ncbi:putative armadillo-like helical protein [Helianthus anomalus]